MCEMGQDYNLNDFDPFHPIFLIDEAGDEQLDSEPMDNYNWDEWLENEK